MQLTAFKGTVLACSLALSGAAFAATPSAEMISNTCFGCHGPNGNSVGPAIPSIAGMAEPYLVEVMKQYKAGERNSTIMTRIAKGYSDEEIELTSAWFASQKYMPVTQTHDAAKAKAGAKLHDKYCDKCHTESGTLADDEAGFLGGQWVPYLKASLNDVEAGGRDVPKKMTKALENAKKKGGDDAIDQLLHFYASYK